MSTINSITVNTSPGAYYISSGVSESALEIQEVTMNLKFDFTRSVTFGEHVAKMLDSLIIAYEEYSRENWDGYNAKSIDMESYRNAVNFALSLPSRIPNPDIYVAPNGEVTFEWYEGKRKIFTVSIGKENELTFAGLYGASKEYGVEYIIEDIPESILERINKLY